MSLDLKLYVEGDDVFEVNLTYNYSQMWALAMGKVGKDHDPPRSFIEAAPVDYVRLVEIEGMTGRESWGTLINGINAMVIDMEAYRALNPENGWGNADLLFQRLQECLKAAAEHPDAVWEAYR